VPEAANKTLTGQRILVIEDDYMIAMDLAYSLQKMGVTVLGPVGSVADALALIGGEPAPDAAVLDVNLGTEKVFPAADALRERGVPFVFATGYDNWIIPRAYADIPLFEKPVDTRAVIRALTMQSGSVFRSQQ
jgi:CheY-like chemotaxis protein